MASFDDKQPWEEMVQERVQLLSEYEHQDCGAVTTVSDRITRKSVLDPFYYGLECTFCVGCQDFVGTKECFLKDGRTVYDATVELRRQSPFVFKFVRFGVVPFLSAVVGGIIGFLATKYVAIGIAGALIGLLLGFFLLARFAALLLRGSGFLWE